MGCQYIVDIGFEGAGTVLESDKPLDFTNQNRVYLYHKEFDLWTQIGRSRDKPFTELCLPFVSAEDCSEGA